MIFWNSKQGKFQVIPLAEASWTKLPFLLILYRHYVGKKLLDIIFKKAFKTHLSHWWLKQCFSPQQH